VIAWSTKINAPNQGVYYNHANGQTQHLLNCNDTNLKFFLNSHYKPSRDRSE
jgi:hypothetical protein